MTGRPRGAVNRSGWYVIKLDKNTFIPVRVRQGLNNRYEASGYVRAYATRQEAEWACRVYNERAV